MADTAKPVVFQKAQPGRNMGAVTGRSLGYTGLLQYNGFVNEEFLKEMQGEAGMRLLTEMADNHPVIGGFMHAISMIIRKVKWRVEAPTDRPKDREAADFLSTCLDDMDFSWQDTLSEILSFLVYGFSYHEICYKPRDGVKSRYDDNLIGWQKIQCRSQDSLYRWDFDGEGNILGMFQHVNVLLPGNEGGHERYIPMEKAILFRTRNYKNNPHGKSLLRNAAVPYLRQRKIEEVEAIGIERDLAGFPVAYIPGENMQESADANQKAVYQAAQKMIKEIRRDSAEGVVLPSDPYVNNDGTLSNVKQFSIELLTSGGTRQFDTTAIQQRYDARIAMTVLADFMMLGHTEVGARSLGDSKTNIFFLAIMAILEIIAENFNRKPVPTLLAINGFETKETPMLVPGELQEADLIELSEFVKNLAASGMPLFPDQNLENHLREMASLPEASLDEGREVGTGSGDRINDRQERATPRGQPEDDAEPAE